MPLGVITTYFAEIMVIIVANEEVAACGCLIFGLRVYIIDGLVLSPCWLDVIQTFPYMSVVKAMGSECSC